jgi:hypothetical protein
MKKLRIIIATILAGTVLLLTPAVALAQKVDPLVEACAQGAQQSSLCQEVKSGNPLVGTDGVITKATQLVSMAVGAVSVIMIIVGGLKYIMSSGDPANTASARNTILYAIIGLVIAIAAQAIVLFVLRLL